jgi:hypothetical protein
MFLPKLRTRPEFCEKEMGQSPAVANGHPNAHLFAVAPAKAGVQLPSCSIGKKLDARLRGHDGWKREVSNNRQHWKRSDFKSGSDIG